MNQGKYHSLIHFYMEYVLPLQILCADIAPLRRPQSRTSYNTRIIIPYEVYIHRGLPSPTLERQEL